MHMKKYVGWVNCTLQMCKAQRLDQFRVCFDLNRFAHHEIDKWLEFAFARQVQRLELDFLKGGVASRYSHYCYTFPAQLLGLNDYAGQPHSNYVHKLPPLLHNFKSLKVLLFKWDWHCEDVESLKIYDTNLVKLGTSSGEKLLLHNVPMLVEVGILSYPRTDILDDMLPQISCDLSQLEVLTIHPFKGLVCVNLTQEYIGKYKFPEFTMLKKYAVVVDTLEDTGLLGCTSVIEDAPQLEEFKLKINAKSDLDILSSSSRN
ncbi:putative retrotransposon-like protein 1-like [Capsicum annuum]|nr:putative retrotransposon-like protein 1-like [Capsicum annuum]